MSLSTSMGLLGRKVGMMRLFTDEGDAVPVTVVDVSNNRVTQVKTEENDGYVALQVTFGSRKASRVTKPQAGHLAKAGVEAGQLLKEFRVPADVAAEYKAGSQVPVGRFGSVGLAGGFLPPMGGGIRNFGLDIGAGYELTTNKLWSTLSPLLGIVLTAGFWALILTK